MRRPYSGDKPITSNYGSRSFYLNGKQITDFHDGIDIGGVFDVLAAEGGTVTSAFRGGRVDANPNSSTPANYVIINHGNGIKTYYWHLSTVDVNVGQTVGKGQKLGVSGRTGYATGNHLHFEVNVNGTSRNPRDYINFSTDSDSGAAQPIPTMDGDFITVQSGWGLSHVAVAAGLVPNSDTYAFIYNLNKGWRGSWDWQSLNARMGPGDQLRVREAAQAPAPQPTPTPVVDNAEIKKKDDEIAKLKADLDKASQNAEKANKEQNEKYEALVLAQQEKDIAAQKAIDELKEQKRQELERASQEYAELEKSSIKIDNSGFDAQATHLAVVGIAEELKARGIKEKWHAWVDAHFRSNFVRQLLKYTWPAWLFFGISATLLAAQAYQGDNQFLVAVIPTFLTAGAAVVQFLLTNYDKDKDGKVDFKDFADILNNQ